MKSCKINQYHFSNMIILWKIIKVIKMLKIENGFRIEIWQTDGSFTVIYRVFARLGIKKQ